MYSYTCIVRRGRVLELSYPHESLGDDSDIIHNSKVTASALFLSLLIDSHPLLRFRFRRHRCHAAASCFVTGL